MKQYCNLSIVDEDSQAGPRGLRKSYRNQKAPKAERSEFVPFQFLCSCPFAPGVE